MAGYARLLTAGIHPGSRVSRTGWALIVVVMQGNDYFHHRPNFPAGNINREFA